MLNTVRRLAHLARWFGPWAGKARAPAVTRETLHGSPGAAPGAFAARVYSPPRRAPDHAFLVVPGLHPDGPDNPRLDRFCAILAASGGLVLSPRLQSYASLRVTPAVFAELEQAFRTLLAHPAYPSGRRPYLFSISFGSLPALHLATSPEHADSIEAMFLFGGYADYARAVDFCLSGEIDGAPHLAHNPLLGPVILTNLVEWLPGAPSDPGQLLDGWYRYVRETWSRPELKEPERWQPIARRIAAELPPAARPLFAVGCGLEPGARELCRAAMARAGERLAFMDPRPRLGGLRCPAHLVHGVGDDVIPWVESLALATALEGRVPVSLHLTRQYGHSRRAPTAAIGSLFAHLRLLRHLAAPPGRSSRPAATHSHRTTVKNWVASTKDR